jgi:hypothetical protein
MSLRSPQVIIKSKLSSNPVYQGSASEMILIQFSHPQSVMNLMKGITGYRGLRERKRGEDWERIWGYKITARNWKSKERLIYQKNV